MAEEASVQLGATPAGSRYLAAELITWDPISVKNGIEDHHRIRLSEEPLVPIVLNTSMNTVLVTAPSNSEFLKMSPFFKTNSWLVANYCGWLP